MDMMILNFMLDWRAYLWGPSQRLADTDLALFMRERLNGN